MGPLLYNSYLHYKIRPHTSDPYKQEKGTILNCSEASVHFSQEPKPGQFALAGQGRLGVDARLATKQPKGQGSARFRAELLRRSPCLLKTHVGCWSRANGKTWTPRPGTLHLHRDQHNHPYFGLIGLGCRIACTTAAVFTLNTEH